MTQPARLDATERSLLVRLRGARYQVVREVGRGATAVVFLCRDRLMHRSVAVKVLRVGTDARDLRATFLAEARLAAGFDDGGIVPVLDILDEDDLTAIVMPYAGSSLTEHVRRRGALPAEFVRTMLVTLGVTIARLHRRGVVHRDIKPDNVLMGGGADPLRVRLADFGIAISRVFDRGVRRHLGIAGSPGFMPPEQALDPLGADQRSDVYALGAVGYFALTAAPPFPSVSLIEGLEHQKRERFRSVRHARPETPRALARVITRCLRANPDHRWADANAMIVALAESGDDIGPRGPRKGLAGRVGGAVLGLLGW